MRYNKLDVWQRSVDFAGLVDPQVGYVTTLAELRRLAKKVGQRLNGSIRNLRTASGERRTAH